MTDQKKIVDDLRLDLQAGYEREYDLQEQLLQANNEIMSLVAANALLEQKIKFRRLQ